MGDLFFTLSPIYRVGSIFGQAMFRPKSDKKIKYFIVDKYSFIYGEFIIILEIILYMYLSSSLIFAPKDSTPKLVFSFERIVGLVYLASCGLTNYYYSKTYANLLNQILIIDKNFKNIKIRINHKIGFKFSLICMLVDIFTAIVYIIILENVNHYYLNKLSEVFFIYIRCISLLEFKILIIILIERFDCLQKNLNKVVITKKNNFKLKYKAIIFETSYLHRSLCKIVTKINFIFGCQLLLFIIYLCICIMSFLYDFIQIMLMDFQIFNLKQSMYHFSDFFLWISYFNIQLLSICTICTKLERKVSLQVLFFFFARRTLEFKISKICYQISQCPLKCKTCFVYPYS